MAILTKFADALNLKNETLEELESIKPVTYLLYTNMVFHAILTLELIFSFFVCQDKKAFVCFMRLMACFGYISYWISITIFFNLKYIGSVNTLIVEWIFGYLSIFKVARLFYFAKCVPAFRVISLTFSSSKQELKILVFLLGILVFVFGYLLFAAELLRDSNIDNLFTAIYWALITLTTVGYGNYVPTTVAGHVVAGACAFCGVLVLALPVGIIVSKFFKYYNYYQYIKTHTKTKEESHVKTKDRVSWESNSLMEEIDL